MRTLPCVLLLLAACRAPLAEPSGHDRAFWRSIAAHDFAAPAGEAPPALALELAGTAGSTDPELRDELGFEISARWIRRPGVLADEDVRALLRLHLANLQRGLGQGESDGVFLRSFSALHLAQVAARDLRRPFLTEAEHAELVQGACRLLREERDRRGWVEGKGWAHPIAHTADLLAHLARASALAPEHQDTLLDALEAGLAGANAFGENERLAAVLVALVARPDFALAAFESRLGRWSQAAEAVWSAKPFDVAAFHEAENTKTLLRAVLLAILLDEQAGEGRRRVADAIRAAFFAGGS